MKNWDLIWGVWAVLTLGSFGILEGTALAQNKMDRTLSRRLRSWLGIRPAKKWGIVGSVALLGFFAWFYPHIVFGWGA